ncbi:MAG: hypothetical protein FWE63_05950 [Bacteroidales bacterium]|nr:hypothetical protein [Bacteroidales bacterium]
MAYKLFDKNGSDRTHHDLQDKGPWCSHGVSKEETFVNRYGEQFSIAINPEKSTNIYAPDLLNTSNNIIGDLKTQNTPFFQAKGRYNINPQYAVTFNVKDYIRYSTSYPSIEMYFWVYWEIVKFQGTNTIEVDPMEGIWFIPFQNLIEVIKTSPIHTYQQRMNDTKGNARDSYVLDLQNPLFTKIV